MSRRTPLTKSTEKPARPSPRPREFGVVPDPSFLRQYPVGHYEQRPIDFYPSRPKRIGGDLLEIGPGRGDFILAEAKAKPDQQFVAVEVGLRRYAKLAARTERLGLTNLLVIGGDARLVLPRCFDAESFNAVVVLFPEPWLKRRHAFNRILQPEFLLELARVLRPGGHLHVKSDVAAYIDWVADNARKISQFRVVEDRWPWGPIGAEAGQTLSLFANRQTSLGYDIHSLCLQRVA